MIDFSRLNPQSFERLVQTVCFRLFGATGKIPSSGPDGGRDFWLEGPIAGYEARSWDGYLVVQSKFCADSANRSAEWLIRMLDKELEQYEKDRRIPQYFIIATNVSLSAADSPKRNASGGLAKVEAYLAQWKKELGVLDFDIWSRDKFEALLLAHPHIQERFAAWIVPSPMDRILSNRADRSADFKSSISLALKTEIKRDQHIRLAEMGNVSGGRVKLSSVFVDLPVHGDTLTSPKLISEIGAQKRNAVSMLLLIASLKLSAHDLDHPRPSIGNISNKVVILGGPGQGKSTIATFLAQLFRAALLREDPRLSDIPELRDIADEMWERAKTLGLADNFPLRYPVLVSLPRYADQIADAKQKGAYPPSILTFIASELSLACDRAIDRAGLRGWFTDYPWVVLMDGLDEVSSGAERLTVLDNISNFEIEISEGNCDVLTVVTTRPQGYSADLDVRVWRHISLSALTGDLALEYAAHLIDSTYPDDRIRAATLRSALKQSYIGTEISDLISTPLQIAIVIFILDANGGIPGQRWSIFEEYYAILCRRERAKPNRIGEVVDRNMVHLRAVHEIAGLVLHIRSEYAGGSQTYLTYEQFAELVRRYLSLEGYSVSECASRASELAFLALDRLVLLSAKVAKRIEFDVRSLQEFMAASKLTNAPASVLERRFQLLSDRSYWRNVFLLMASRCFSENSLHYMRSTVTQCPRLLSDASEGNAGAYLALEMLADGIGIAHPISRSVLVLEALDLLENGLDALPDEMFDLWVPPSSPKLPTELARRLHGDSHFAAAALLIIKPGIEVGSALDIVSSLPRARNKLASFYHRVRPYLRLDIEREVEVALIKQTDTWLGTEKSGRVHLPRPSEDRRIERVTWREVDIDIEELGFDLTSEGASA
ncbi:hypothetical protein HFO89_31335 [Rhizobium leguminosarum]|uniref:NACHT domain-containing protein n=1 Tax=Rhizobium leguminosarum TaxID=384 RepID=UPI001C9822A3|nr:hypothetical protein [Rhizobium leguminosarum]MBY5460771.1 hypothetical protein [Rhizobium leguminosarum]